MTGKPRLPIDEILPALMARLASQTAAVLVAPPGAGKTTRVAPELIRQPWCTGRVLLLAPRRIAVRSAAEYMARELGENPGGTIGYQTRLESSVSRMSRVIVMTPGIFVNRIVDDPEMEGVTAVLFDEVHERGLDSDLALALAIEAQAAFRPDIRLLAMSATLEGERFSALLNGAEVTETLGQSWPLDVIYLGRRAEARIEDEMANAIRRALREIPGDILAFLPGVGEINRTAERLDELGPSHIVLPLHGQIDPLGQRAALRPDQGGRRKIILATSIAETSVTVEGVRIVIDSGLSRRPRFDVAAGVTRLETVRVAQSTATQRAGRAARQGPGVCYRLWEEAATSGFSPHERAEILESDLAPLLLKCAQWGETDPTRLPWLDPPPPASLAAAKNTLQAIDAIDDHGAITNHGKAIVALAMPPQLAHMLLFAARHGQEEIAAELALLLQEPGLGGRSENLLDRLDRFRSERGKRAQSARGLANRWAGQARKKAGEEQSDATAPPEGILLAMAYPERLARRRHSHGTSWQSAGGRNYTLPPGSPLAGSEWLAVADVQGKAAGARVVSAIPLSILEVEQFLGDRIRAFRHVEYRPSEKRVEARKGVALGAITLKIGPDDTPDPDKIEAALIDAVREKGLSLLPLAEASVAVLERARFAGLHSASETQLLETLSLWLGPLLSGRRSFAHLSDRQIAKAIDSSLPWGDQQTMARLAPPEFRSPLGTSHLIDYGAEQGPTVRLRVQALFGLAEHPVIGSERIPLVLELLSPAGRPIQTTRDLPGFWAGSWADVARDMKGRYPKHRWPDDPANELPSLKTKAALARDG